MFVSASVASCQRNLEASAESLHPSAPLCPAGVAVAWGPGLALGHTVSARESSKRKEPLSTAASIGLNWAFAFLSFLS